MERYICIHGHFYQPPRENPWLEEVEYQGSAAPYHDWNERITAECYATNAAAKILDHDGKITDIVNNYSKISFNFGPTLLSWLHRHNPDVYRAIQEADRLSIERFSGHGSALAQVYNHMIMPLANGNDKVTQVIWGIRDFEARFGRKPEGIWLAETAVDLETLDVLADYGILFTILAPRQAYRVKRPADNTPSHEIMDNESEQVTDEMPQGEETPENDLWSDVSDGRIDPAMPYLCRLPSGRTITLFFYDGPISGDIAFSGVLQDATHFVNRLSSAFTDTRDFPQLVHIATDGETYGHHHKNGEMALAYCLHLIESGNYQSEEEIKLTNYGQYLEKHPPVYEVEIYDGSSWSCVHGIGRWMHDCGCCSGMHQGWSQRWRAPLRQTMDWLRDRLAAIFETEAGKYLSSPWDARNDYIDVILDRNKAGVHSFIDKHAAPTKTKLSMLDRTRVLKLLEMQRNAMLMYTSCGWFFDEISGIETVQIMEYAARAMQYAQELTGISFEDEYIERLSHAHSNIFRSGSYPYEEFVKPSKVDIMRAAAHYAISSLFTPYPKQLTMFCYAVQRLAFDEVNTCSMRLATGRIKITSEITWDERTLAYVVLNLDDHSINCKLKESPDGDNWSAVTVVLKDAFGKGNIPEVISLMQRHFKGDNYSFSHLFRDGQRRVLDILSQGEGTFGIDAQYKMIYESHYPLMDFYRGLQVPLPKSLSIAAAYTMEKDLMGLFEAHPHAIEKLMGISNEIKKWNIEIDTYKLGYHATPLINHLAQMLATQREAVAPYDKLSDTLDILKSLSIEPDLWKAHRIYFITGKELRHVMSDRAASGDESAHRWLFSFRRLGSCLGIKTDNGV